MCAGSILSLHFTGSTAHRSRRPHLTSQVLFSVCLVVVFAMWTAASLAGAGMRMTNSVYALCGAGIASIFAVLGATVGWGSLKGEISSHPMVKMMGEIGTTGRNSDMAPRMHSAIAHLSLHPLQARR